MSREACLSERTRNFCTLFDSHYLTRGLALYRSLERSLGNTFILVIFCFDDPSYDLLSRLRLKCATLVRLSDFETPKLLTIKNSRSRREYCWTCTPLVIEHCITKFSLPEVTYVDADLYFFNSPEPLFQELDNVTASVSITNHRYSAEYDQSKTSGKYCVQFMTFRNSQQSLAVLGWWRDRCLEWCYDRHEDGKFGDQKYLDDWLSRFPGTVHELNHHGCGIAPWNVQQFEVDQGPTVDQRPIIFYHFHILKWLDNGFFDLSGGTYVISKNVMSWIYRPYLNALRQALTEVRALDPTFDEGKVAPARGVKNILLAFRNRLRGTHLVVHE